MTMFGGKGAYLPQGERVLIPTFVQEVRVPDTNSAHFDGIRRDPVEVRTLPDLQKAGFLDQADGGVRVSRDGRFVLATTTNHSILQIYSGTNFPLLGKLRGTDFQFGKIAISQGGTYAAAGTRRGEVFLWENPETPAAPKQIETMSTLQITALEFSGDSRWLAAGFYDGSIRVISTENGDSLPVLQGHRKEITALLFIPGSDKLLSADNTGEVRFWPLSPPAPPASTEWDLEAHQKFLTVFAQADRASGTNSYSGLAKILDEARGWDISFDGRWVAVLAEGKRVEVRNAMTGEVQGDFPQRIGTVDWVEFEKTGSVHVRRWPAEGAAWSFLAYKRRYEMRRSFQGATSRLFVRDTEIDKVIMEFEEPGSMCKYDVSEGEIYLAVASGTMDDVKVYTLADSNLVHTLSSERIGHYGVQFSPDSRTLATLGRNGRITLWNLKTGRRLFSLQGPADPMFDSLKFAATGNGMVVRAEKGERMVWYGSEPD